METMETGPYFYKDQTWSICPTVEGNDSFFHSILGTRADETEEYFDKHSQFRRMRWATFLTYYKNEPMPSSVQDYLTKSLSAIDRYRHSSVDDTLSLTNYITSIIAAEQNVTIEELTLLATLENVKIELLLSTTSDAVIIVEPDPDFLESYPIPNVDEEPNEVILCLRGNTFSRLELASEDTTSSANRTIEGTTTFRKIVRTAEEALTKFKKGGSAGSKGVQFQVYLLTVVLLNAFRNLIDWRLSTENVDAKKFDDIVLESSEGATFIQCKYKENQAKKISLDELLSTNTKNSDFSLPKYVVSYLKLKKTFKNVKNIIICTNAGIDNKVQKFLHHEQANEKSVLYIEDISNSLYTFNEEILSDLSVSCSKYHESNYMDKSLGDSRFSEEAITDFLRHLQLYCNYPSFDNLKRSVDKVKVPLTRYCSNSRDRIYFSEIYPKVMDWFQEKVGRHLNETYAKAMFADIWHGKYCHRLEQYKASFQRNNLNFDGIDQIFQISGNGGCLLQEIKVYQAIKNDKMNVLFLHSDDDEDIKELMVKAFGFCSYIYLIIVWNNSAESIRMCNELRVILQLHHYKKIILVGKNSDELATQIIPQVFIEVNVKFDDLSVIFQNRLLNKKNIDFQGHHCNLNDLLGRQTTHDYNEVVKSDVLEKLVKSEDIKVGSAVQPLHNEIKRYYIHRNFSREIEDEETDETYEDTYSEEDIYQVSDKFVIIENRGGMGKTTVLTNLAAIIKRDHPQKWVVRIEFNKCKDTLKELLKKKRDAISITELLHLSGSTELESEFEDFVFSLENKIVLILDAVDEISEEISPYLGLILSLFEQCQEAANISKVFVASREHAIQALVEKLNVKPFKLMPFEKEDYEDFFVKFWTAKLSLTQDEMSRCRIYAKAVVSKMGPWLNPDCTRRQSLVVVPLQLKMLGEIFQERGRFEISEIWDGCKEFVSGDMSRPNLPKRVNTAKLFRMLIEKKGDFLIDESDSSDREVNTDMLLRKYYEYFAYRKML